MSAPDCKYFSGYKPCDKSAVCDRQCKSYRAVEGQLLIVHLEALGAVVRSTALLPAIRRKYPRHQINWLTRSNARPLLENNPLIDRVFTTDPEDMARLSALEFEEAYLLDKSLLATGLITNLRIARKVGFGVDARTGAIKPLNASAVELYEIGLSNQKKFFENTKPETQLCIEALELGPYERDEYHLSLSNSEWAQALERRSNWLDGRATILVGINVGCSSVIPYKKLGVLQHQRLIQKLSDLSDVAIVLLGGKEDLQQSVEIAKAAKGSVIVSDHMSGLRDGMVSIAACDVVISGDSLGMHLAIALKKWVVAWFGPTCAQEIDLFDRGVKVSTKATCSPCWKRSCHKPVMCYDQVQFDELRAAVLKGIEWKMSLSKPPFSEMSF